MNMKKLFITIVLVIMTALLITGGSYAYFSWQSDNNKLIVFNTASELKKYVVYDSGDSKFVGEFRVGNSYTDGVHSTISIYKTADANNTNIVANINLDINDIGTNMSNSTGIKWAVTEGDANNIGELLGEGNFNGYEAGDTITLVSNIMVSTELKYYTVWIWADASIIDSDDLFGETVDTTIWTEINQLEGAGNVFDITNQKVNYQNIMATILSSNSKITDYQVSNSNTEPSSWVAISEQGNIYNLNYSVNTTGTYYIWARNASGSVVSKEINVTNVDLTGPVCTFGNFSDSSVDFGETVSINLDCIDSDSGISNLNLTNNDFNISNGHISISNITRSVIENGYRYTLTVLGGTGGDDTLVLLANKVSNMAGIYSGSVTSGSISVKHTINISEATINLSQNSYTYDGNAKEPTVSVILDGDTLTLNTDYVVTYTDNISAGTATVTVSGTNDYSGTAIANFTITYNTFAITLNNGNATSNGTSTLYVRYGDGIYLDSSYVNKMTTENYPIEIPLRTDYSFNGYYDGNILMIAPNGYITSNLTSTTYSSATTLSVAWINKPTAPSYSVKYVANDNLYTAGVWTNQDVYIELSSTSPDVSIDGFQYSVDSGATWTDLTCDKSNGVTSSNNVYSCEQNWNTSGNFSIIFRALYDNSLIATDESNILNLKYDNVLPSGSLETNYANNVISTNVIVNDSHSGDSGTYGYSVDTSSTCGDSVSFFDSNATSYNYTIPSNGIYYVCVRISDNANNVTYLSEEVDASRRIGEPVLDETLIPVIIANDGTVTAVSREDDNWFDYENKIWANAVVTTGTNRSTYQQIANGTHSTLTSMNIPSAEILAYYVWIPRYKYALATANGSPEAISIVFEERTVTKSNGTATGNSYYTHPAFTFGEDELDGFWIGKFELSGGTNGMGCSNNTCSYGDNLRILPNTAATRSNTVQSFFYAVASMGKSGNIFGFSTDGSVDSHMIKGTEWGAVAYLSHSVYGINDEIRLNNNSGYKTGCGAASNSSDSVSACTIAYGSGTTSGGTIVYPQSTTGNITGVFDMSGGAGEYTMGNFNRTVKSGGANSLSMDGKYYNIYTSAAVTDCTLAECGGQALNETSGWYGDFTTWGTANAPWYVRGGAHNNAASAGIFSYEGKDGNSGAYRGTRAILSPIYTGDDTAPVCTFGEFSNSSIGLDDMATINLTCIDTDSDIDNINLTSSNITITNDNVSVSNITRERVTNGYRYIITITGNSVGTDSISLASGVISNTFDLGNEAITSGSITINNTISLSNATVTLNNNTYTYDGTAKEPVVTVELNGNTLTKDTDYTVQYTNNINAGEATVTIHGINTYSGYKDTHFTISYNAFTITLDNNLATVNGTSTLYIRYADGVYLDGGYNNIMTSSTNNITIPERSGYVFKGYYDGNTQLIDGLGYITSNFTTTKYQSTATLNADWEELEYKATIYYYDSRIKTEKLTCNPNPKDLSSGCNVTIPNSVINSTGTYGTSYNGLSTSLGNMTQVTASNLTQLNLTDDVTYYALYQTEVTEYLKGTNRTIYRNSYMSNITTYDTVLSTSQSGTTNLTTESYTNDEIDWSWYGYATSAGTTQRAHSSASYAAKATDATLYTLYSRNASATLYYYNGTGQTTVTASGTQITNSDITEFLEGIITVPSAVTSSTGPKGISYFGLSLVTSSTVVTTTINTANTTYYAIYGGDFTARFIKDNNSVSAIGTSSLTCTGFYTTDGTTYSGQDCSITLPTITPISGYTVLGWYNGNTVGMPGDNLILTSSGTYEARAKELTAKDFSYDGTDTGVKCKTTQCMIDCLANETCDIVNEELPSFITDNAVMDNVASTYVTSSTGINFADISSSTNGQGIYIRAGTENDPYPIYYYRGAVTNNNVLFGNVCWKIVRTTDTGGVKLVYNGLPTSGSCLSTGAYINNSSVGFNNHSNASHSLADVGYMYGAWYETHRGNTNISKYGNSFSYSGGTYTLVDTITSTGTWSVDRNNLNNNHYRCYNYAETCLQNLYYVFRTTNDFLYYIGLSNGKGVEQALDEMLTLSSNTTNSSIKTNIDKWYNTNLTNYTNYLEDTVWCNDREIYKLGGWDPNGGNTGNYLFFAPNERASLLYYPQLTCNSANDSFTVNIANGNGNLTYPVGLLTVDEAMLAGGKAGSDNNSYYLYLNQAFWLISPVNYDSDGAHVWVVNSTGKLNSADARSDVAASANIKVRPSISLKPGGTWSGEGTANNPYTVSWN